MDVDRPQGVCILTVFCILMPRRVVGAPNFPIPEQDRHAQKGRFVWLQCANSPAQYERGRTDLIKPLQ
jgi:hypothetical protein